MRTAFVLALLVALTALPGGASAQTAAAADPAGSQAAIWKTFAAQVTPGTELDLRLRSGQRFRATLIAARDDALLVQPRTRIPVPVQPVPYDAIVAMDRRESRGMSAGRAAAIGVASGAGTFVAILLFLMAALD